MKTLFTLFITLFLFASVEAKIVYLNNNLEVPKISENLYINWADAYAAASAGDTIYVSGSTFSYGAVEISKQLTIIGPGYYLNTNPNSQVDKRNAIFNVITFAAGSDNSELIGVKIPNENYRYINITEGASGIKILKSLVKSINFVNRDYDFDNIQIMKCVIYSGSISSCGYYCHGIITNLVVTNNIIYGGFDIEDGSSGIISHNLFISDYLSFGSSSSFEITDNIYLNGNEDNFSIQPLPDASVHNNISLTGAFGSDNNNITVPQSTLFITDENASSDGKYMLSENSPAKGAGSKGSDIGPFGGPDPYRLSGLPNLPNIYELSTGGLVSGDELPVRIKIKQ